MRALALAIALAAQTAPKVPSDGCAAVLAALHATRSTDHEPYFVALAGRMQTAEKDGAKAVVVAFAGTSPTDVGAPLLDRDATCSDATFTVDSRRALDAVDSKRPLILILQSTRDGYFFLGGELPWMTSSGPRNPIRAEVQGVVARKGTKWEGELSAERPPYGAFGAGPHPYPRDLGDDTRLSPDAGE